MTIQELKARLEARAPQPMDAAGRCAVLVPLVEREGELYLLYEVRAASLRRQPREVCFPGGRMEPGETPLECALREMEEELSIPRSAVRVIAPMDFLFHRSGFILYPILAQVDARAADTLVPNPAEVDEVFLVPLERLRDQPAGEYRYELIPTPPEDFPYELIGIPRDYPWQKGVEVGPVYPWEGKAIWGLTGRITRRLLELTRQDPR